MSMLPVKKPSLPLKGAFARAAARVAAAKQPEGPRYVRIGFAIDATGSREKTWEQAQLVQARMFRTVSQLSNLSVRLVHFGGGLLSDHGWCSAPDEIAARMARVRCEAGMTQILPALRRFLEERQGPMASAVILVGDCFEECGAEADEVAAALKAAGIKVFSFHEGDEPLAEAAFRRLATKTGGKFAKLGAELPLSDLCEGVALLAAGGEKALSRLSNRRVKQLLLPAPGKAS